MGFVSTLLTALFRWGVQSSVEQSQTSIQTMCQCAWKGWYNAILRVFTTSYQNKGSFPPWVQPVILFVNAYLRFESLRLSLSFFCASPVLWQFSWSCRDSTQSHEESLAVLRSSTEFLRYAVSVALQKVQQLEETGQTDGPDGQNPEKMFQNLCKITQWVSVACGDISNAFGGFFDSQVGFWKKNSVRNCFKQLLLLGWGHCLSVLPRNHMEALQFLCHREWYSSNNLVWKNQMPSNIFSLFLTSGSSLIVTEKVRWLQAGFLRPLECSKV